MEKLGFEKLPTILSSKELIDKAFKEAAVAAREIRGPPREVDKLRERRRIEVMSSTLSNYLSKFVSGFPTLQDLQPFYRDLVESIFGIDRLRRSLGAISGTVRTIDKIKREHLRRLRSTRSAGEAASIRRQAYGRISSVVKMADENLNFLREVSKKLSDLPAVYVGLPTIVIAGYPNVGKSTLLKALTSSTPKIAPYPFTTTGLQLGYFEHRHQRYQVIDTPGLFDRPLEKRNPIERQAMAALRHLARTIVFILDPSETCGYELKDQLHLLEEIKNMFGGIEVIVVVNKMDLIDEAKRQQVQEREPGALFMVASTGEGVGKLRERLL